MIASQSVVVDSPRVRPWTREEYYKMYDLDLFAGQRVELIGGEVIEMAPQHNSHAVTIGLVDDALRSAFGSGHWIRCQLPLSLGQLSEPEPDFAVVKGSPRDFSEHPSSALLVVEVSESSFTHDSQRKAGLYAAAGIADYWVVNIADRTLHVLRNPEVDTHAEFGFRYSQIVKLKENESISPIAKPQSAIPVSSLLP